MVEERLLRFAAPQLYNLLVEALSSYHIQPNAVHATLETNENGFDVILRLTTDFSQTVTQNFRPEQKEYPDEEVQRFFEMAAGHCHSNYYRIM